MHEVTEREWSYTDRQTGLTGDDVTDDGRLVYSTQTGDDFVIEDACRDCGVGLTADNVWEPGTCLACARLLTRDDLHGNGDVGVLGSH